MLGIQVDRLALDSRAGDIALTLKRAYDQAVALNEFLVRTPDTDLEALGFTAPEIATLKSAFADLAFGKENSFDSSAHVKLLYGMGS